MQNPLVSVIVNCYNGSKFIARALNSILNQTYANFEIIFYDNCSDDDSLQIAKNISDIDNRVKVFLADNHTHLGEARYHAIKKISGEILTFLDVDDYWVPEKLELQVNLLSSSDYDYCFGGTIRVDENGNNLGAFIPQTHNGIQFSELVYDYCIDMVTPAILVKSMRNLNINFNPDIHSSEEVNFFLRFSLKAKGYTFKSILGYSTYRTNSLTFQNSYFWSIDLNTTINQLINENPFISTKHYNEIEYLNFKKDYLNLKFLIYERNYKQAILAIQNINYKSNISYLLKLFRFTPSFLRFIFVIFAKYAFLRHNRVFKFFLDNLQHEKK